MWHPLRLAEDFAVADILTKGRTVFGVGRGYHTREVETFGAPMLDQEANRELFEEQVEIIFKAFNEEAFSHKGKHYTLPPAVPYRGYELKELTLVPRPVNRPVECWQPVVSASARGLDFMVQARHQGRGRRRRRDHGGGADPGLPRRRGAGRQGPRARREPHRRHLLPPRRQPRAGDPRDDPLLRGARQDVRPARLRAGRHAAAGGGRRPPRRLGGRRRAQRSTTT